MTPCRSSRTIWQAAAVVVVLSAVAAWLIAWPAYKRHRAIADIESIGGIVFRQATGPKWLHRWGVGFTHVHLVDLFGTPITDHGLPNLSTLKDLEYLDLSYTQLTDHGLEHVGRLTTLRHLSLEGTQISDGGVKHLCRLTALRRLIVDDTRITKHGMETLHRALPECDLSPNAVPDTAHGF